MALFCVAMASRCSLPNANGMMLHTGRLSIAKNCTLPLLPGWLRTVEHILLLQSSCSASSERVTLLRLLGSADPLYSPFSLSQERLVLPRGVSPPHGCHDREK